MMLNRFFQPIKFYIKAAGLILVFSSSVVLPAMAQQCTAPFETITRLRHPLPGAFALWNTVYGEEGRRERFISAVGVKGNHVVVAGDVVVVKGVKPALLLAELDQRGRVVWERIHNIPHLKNIQKIIKNGDQGYVVLAHEHKRSAKQKIWLGFFDVSGKLVSQKYLSDKKDDYTAKDIQPRVDGSGWIIPVSVSRSTGVGDAGDVYKKAHILLLDKKGKPVKDRAYVLGLKTNISKLYGSKFRDQLDGYIATGYFENDNGKKIAWAVRIGADLSMVWQKEFSRGQSANIVSNAVTPDGDVLALANIKTADSLSDGVWFARLEGTSGELLWQRYYGAQTGRHDYSAEDVIINKDGLIDIMMMARYNPKTTASKREDLTPPEIAHITAIKGYGVSEKSNYAHMLTLTPRGVTLSGDAFYLGEKGVVKELNHDSKGRRIFSGYGVVPIEDTLKNKHAVKSASEVETPLQDATDVRLPDVELSDKTKKGLALLQKKIGAGALNVQNEDDELHSESDKMSHKDKLVTKGWVILGDAADPYKDPCK